MLVVVWVSLASVFYSGNAHNSRHERTRYVSSRNQIYGGNFDYNEKYIPFVHYWERPLQVLESSMKIPKKLSSRPLFSWDLPVQMTSHTSTKTATTENSVTKEIPDAIPILKSRPGRAKALADYPDSYDFIPTKQKKSTNRKKSIKLKEFTAESPTSVKMGPDGKIKRKKKGKKSKKGKKNGKRMEMNDVKVPEVVGKRKPEVRSSCERLERKCEHHCEESNGEATCVCFRGFMGVGNKCQDINECETNNGGCNGGKCVNTMGSRKCICSPGFRLVDDACADINECLLRNGHGPCQDKCTNTMGSYYCTCDGLPGTKLSSDGHTCEENECNLNSAGCSHTCISISGRAYCTCPDGMELGDDWKTCHDVDECSNPEDYNVQCEFGCVNTVGSYKCATGNGSLT